jgi:hypothetical protein
LKQRLNSVHWQFSLQSVPAEWSQCAKSGITGLLYVRQLSDPLNWGSRGREPYTSW